MVNDSNKKIYFNYRLLIRFYLNHMDKKHLNQFTGFYVTIQNGFKKLWESQSEVWILWLKNLQTWVEMMDLNFYHGKMIFSGKFSVSVLDNALNQVVGCIIQKRYLAIWPF